MKVTLVSPYSDITSPGIRIISACLKQKNHDVKIIFLPRRFNGDYQPKNLDELVELSRDSDLIGITLMSNFFNNAVKLTRRLKESLSTPVLWGGIHPTLRPEECLDHADMVCIGEGEEAIVELAGKMEEGKPFFDTKSLWFRNQGAIVKNDLRPLIQDLNPIPFQDYDYNSHYIISSGRLQKMNERLLHLHLGKDYLAFPSRGCPFGCAYCCNNALNKMYHNQKPIRKRNLDNVIEELSQVKKKLPFINHITFDDDAFFIYGEDEIGDFCGKYRRKINLPLDIGGATPTTVTKKKLSFLVDAGLTGLRMGVQTGSERTKKLYKRHYSNQQVEKTVNLINEFKDKITDIRYDIILNNPWETEEDLVDSLSFLARFPVPYRLNNYDLTFFPGTELYEKAKKEGVVSDDRRDVYHKSYNKITKTSLNDLFSLLSVHSYSGNRISPRMMSLLANREPHPIKSWLLYNLLKGGAFLLKIRYALQRIWVSLEKKDRNRIERWYQYKYFINR